MKRTFVVAFAFALILCMSVTLVGCGGSSYDESAEAKVVSSCFDEAIDNLEFVRDYAGNTNGNGSRKFADSFIVSLEESLTGINEEFVAECLPQTAEKLDTIKADINTVRDLLVDMGETNSPANVPTMRTICIETISILEYLQENEIDLLITE